MCRVNQDALLRFTEVGWQIWNLWAIKLFSSCADVAFHPLGVILDEEWQKEDTRLAMVEEGNIRRAQSANLEEVKRLRDLELQRYNTRPHSFKEALSEATKTMKALGLSL